MKNVILVAIVLVGVFMQTFAGNYCTSEGDDCGKDDAGVCISPKPGCSGCKLKCDKSCAAKDEGDSCGKKKRGHCEKVDSSCSSDCKLWCNPCKNLDEGDDCGKFDRGSCELVDSGCVASDCALWCNEKHCKDD